MAVEKMRIDADLIEVSDLNKASAYYTSVFGAEVLGTDNSDSNRELSIGGHMFRLAPPAIPADRHEHVVRVPDVDLCVARVATRGGRIVTLPQVGNGGVREGRVEDPFGHIWRVSAL
ncbi:MAG: VOC family protein [Pseudomonadota bacterium]